MLFKLIEFIDVWLKTVIFFVYQIMQIFHCLCKTILYFFEIEMNELSINLIVVI